MTTLPDGWTTCPFTDAFDVQGGTQPPKSTFIHQPRPGYVQLLQIRDFGSKPVPTYIEDTSSLKKCSEQDILIARYGASLGRILTGLSGAYNVAMAKVDIPDGFVRRYVFHLLNSSHFQDPLKLVSRSAQNGFNKSDLSEFLVPIAPINEQKRIADKLDSLLSRVDSCRERLDRVPAILNRFRQSVLAAAISGKLTEEWRERNGVSLESWKSEPLGDLLSAIESGINVKCTERPPQPTEKGLVKISAVTWGAYNDDESKTLPAEMEIPASTRIQIGDFLISRANTLELVGACVIVDRVSRPVYLSDKVLRLVLPEELKLWILYFLRSAEGRKQIESLASGNQLSMRNISQASLRSIMIKLPSTSEREEIIAKVKSLLDSADRLGRRYEAAHKSTEILNPSILAKAFRGDLVPQNPDDEPASVLLERIREQRQISSPNKAKRPTKKTPRAPKKKAAMTKSRFDQDVLGKPYLASFLKGSKRSLSAEDLFKKADLPLVDFYKQLDFEVKQKLIVERDGQLEAA